MQSVLRLSLVGLQGFYEAEGIRGLKQRYH